MRIKRGKERRIFLWDKGLNQDCPKKKQWWVRRTVHPAQSDAMQRLEQVLQEQLRSPVAQELQKPCRLSVRCLAWINCPVPPMS